MRSSSACATTALCDDHCLDNGGFFSPQNSVCRPLCDRPVEYHWSLRKEGAGCPRWDSNFVPTIGPFHIPLARTFFGWGVGRGPFAPFFPRIFRPRPASHCSVFGPATGSSPLSCTCPAPPGPLAPCSIADRLGPSLGVPSASPKKPEPSPKKTLTKGADHASRAAAKHTPTAAAAAAVTATSNGDVPPPTPVDANFVDDLKQKLYDFQFAILNMRDQLFPPPPEAPENAEGEPPAPDPMLTPEELELQEKRRVLKDDWLLTSKKCVGSDILDHMMYLQHELRYLTFVSAQREQLVDQLQYAVEHGQREESDAEIARLQSELAHMQSAATSMRQQLELQAGHVPDGHADLDGPFPTDTSSIPSIDSPRSMTQPPAVPPLLPGTEDQRKDTVIKELQV